VVSAVEELHPAISHHVVNSLGWRALRPLQELAAGPLVAGEHALLLAPTAGGKTEAAFFPLLSRMLTEGWHGLSLLYVCPIKALLNNLEPRLARYAALVGRRVELWHGDVGEAARRRVRGDPPDVLLTTPESIEVLLDSRRVDHKAFFTHTRAVVIDELHAFAGDDRGWHLMAVLERVTKLAGRELQRIGLSATIGNPQELLAWLAAHCAGERRVIVAPPLDGAIEPKIDLDFVGKLSNAALVISRLHRGEKRLVFCDSRARVEDLAARLRSAGVNTFVSHASLSVDERRRAEEAFATGSDCVIVATSTLELGMDVGDLDRVIQVDAPPTVASFLQRIGRTGRRPGTTRSCLFLATSDSALAVSGALLSAWSKGYVEPIEPPRAPLHILAQQTLAMVLQLGAIQPGTWREWLGRLSVFESAAEDMGRIIEHLLATDILFDDGAALVFGRAGERAFGRKNFLELFSVFTGPPLVTVLHGGAELGHVHPASFVRSGVRPVVLLLGGRSWRVTHLDWARRVAYVEPAQTMGRSRWLGTSQAMDAVLCREVRSVLAGAHVPATLSRRAEAQLAAVRDAHAWVCDGRTSLVRDVDGGVRFWTFAGMRANAMLCERLRSLAGNGRADNLSIPLRAGVAFEEVESWRHEAMRGDLVAPVDDDALKQLKFSECLPRALAVRVLSERLGDPVAARACLAESPSDVTLVE
jgi:ATP-dependent helicase Lhr and Lhr-like helicase